MLSPRDVFPKANGCSPHGSGTLSLRPRDALPKAERCIPRGMLSPKHREALPEAKGCIPQGRCSPRGQGMLSQRLRDALPKELCLPTAAAQSSRCQLRGRGFGSRVPPQRGAAGQWGREGKSGCQGRPCSPACCQPCHVHAARLPSAPLGCPPPLAHAFGCT